MTANPVYSDGMTSPTEIPCRPCAEDHPDRGCADVGCTHDCERWVRSVDPADERTREVDRVALLLMAAWEAAEGKAVGVSYVATFADMARAVVADRGAIRESIAEQVESAIAAHREAARHGDAVHRAIAAAMAPLPDLIRNPPATHL